MRITIRNPWLPRPPSVTPPDVAVFFDVFRASTTLAALVSKEPREILSTNDRAAIDAFVSEGYMLVSEVFQGGLDNSPTQVLAAAIAGRQVVHKSTNLTAAIFHEPLAKTVLIAGFANMGATVRCLSDLRPGSVELVPAGHFLKRREAPEDAACAEVMAARLGGAAVREVPRRAEIDALIARVRETGAHADHYFDDVALALEFDRFPWALAAEPVRDGLIRIIGKRNDV